MENTNIIIVDDHKIFRDGLILLLSNFDFVSVVGEAANGEEFLELIDNVKPDIVLMDINMPKMNGIEATKLALQKYPELKVIALTSFADDEYIEQMISAGVEGYMLKRSDIEDFEKAIKKVADGGSYFSAEIIKVISRNLYKEKERKSGEQLLDKFTPREKEILNLICKGLNNEQIAELIHLSPKTVEKHKSNLFQKTETFNTVNLVIYAFKNQLISL
ncbi:two component transcriptional regulator, LuxR family [Draconibacterium orientale]|jgi:DNA-binding NarL/FixJ family response regulator|uniref:Histidine kinase n=1 Tax=Draconibacterium orientale TaxID=1168034 RepID=X5DX58_9BACT|nr:response regulator transcription factor [Draconibacterium orientale]AHW58836.1 histidine kinase [Draconibacterium orientale]SEU14827.1 two component transcriptional regulator, LuxR family [Draconibacterium orientale]